MTRAEKEVILNEIEELMSTKTTYTLAGLPEDASQVLVEAKALYRLANALHLDLDEVENRAKHGVRVAELAWEAAQKRVASKHNG